MPYKFFDLVFKDKKQDLDSRSRPESQRVTSCANRLVITPTAYGNDGEWGPELDPGSTPYRDDGSKRFFRFHNCSYHTNILTKEITEE